MNEFDHLPGSRFGQAAESASAFHHKAATSYGEYLKHAQHTIQGELDKVSRTSADSVRENMIARARADHDKNEFAKKCGIPVRDWTHTGESAVFAASSPEGSRAEWAGIVGSEQADALIRDTHRILNQQFRNPSRASTNDPDSLTPATPTLMQGFNDRNSSSNG